MPSFRIPRTPLVVSLVGALLAGTGAAAAPPGPDAPADPLAEPAARVDQSVTAATLNILGSNHTRGGDYRRTVRTAKILNRRSIGVLGLQEVQEGQLRVLQHHMPRYRFWPGLTLDRKGVRLQIAWSRNRFDLLDTGTITTTFSHQRRPIPWVRLRHEPTGRRLSVIDIHNSPQGQERARDSATRRQLALYRTLRRRGPVLLVGDANEKAEWFCKVTGRTDARAANGGSHGRRGCRPPSPIHIDWLMGGGRIGWRGYLREDVTTSDHALFTADVRFG
jgi:endonuclease/exonuclease/phosphatase family metal-dependent hydrolase